MGRGRPIALKCPKCMRGKYGYDRQIRGVMVIGHEVKIRGGKGQGHGSGAVRFYGHYSLVECLDCGHTWSSTRWRQPLREGTPHRTVLEMSDANDLWAVQEANGHWYPCDHMLLNPSVTSDARNARPFYGASGRHDAALFCQGRPGRKVVPHPRPDLWRHCTRV